MQVTFTLALHCGHPRAILVNRNRLHHHAALAVSGRWLPGKGIHPGLVVQSSVDATQIIAGDQALEHFVHRVAATQVEKIHRRPHFGYRGLVNALHHLSFDDGRRMSMTGSMSANCVHTSDSSKTRNDRTSRKASQQQKPAT